jgi:hypothetical protein
MRTKDILLCALTCNITHFPHPQIIHTCNYCINTSAVLIIPCQHLWINTISVCAVQRGHGKVQMTLLCSKAATSCRANPTIWQSNDGNEVKHAWQNLYLCPFNWQLNNEIVPSSCVKQQVIKLGCPLQRTYSTCLMSSYAEVQCGSNMEAGWKS